MKVTITLTDINKDRGINCTMSFGRAVKPTDTQTPATHLALLAFDAIKKECARRKAQLTKLEVSTDLKS